MTSSLVHRRDCGAIVVDSDAATEKARRRTVRCASIERSLPSRWSDRARFDFAGSRVTRSRSTARRSAKSRGDPADAGTCHCFWRRTRQKNGIPEEERKTRNLDTTEHRLVPGERVELLDGAGSSRGDEDRGSGSRSRSRSRARGRSAAYPRVVVSAVSWYIDAGWMRGGTSHRVTGRRGCVLHARHRVGAGCPERWRKHAERTEAERPKDRGIEHRGRTKIANRANQGGRMRRKRRRLRWRWRWRLRRRAATR